MLELHADDDEDMVVPIDMRSGSDPVESFPSSKFDSIYSFSTISHSTFQGAVDIDMAFDPYYPADHTQEDKRKYMRRSDGNDEIVVPIDVGFVDQTSLVYHTQHSLCSIHANRLTPDFQPSSPDEEINIGFEKTPTNPLQLECKSGKMINRRS